MKHLFLVFLLLVSVPALAAENAYERVQSTGILRCGYILWPPFMERDPNTGAFSGMSYEYAEALAQSLGLKIEWVEEVIPGQQVESLRSGKIDAVCTADGPVVPATGRYLYYSDPIITLPFYLYARADDPRFDHHPEKVNTPSTKIALLDGDVSGEVATVRFPNASRFAMPQIALPSQMLVDVAEKKADVAITDNFSVLDYNRKNPNVLKRVPGVKALANIQNTFSVLQAPGGLELTALLNQGIINVRNFGREDVIFEKYHLNSD